MAMEMDCSSSSWMRSLRSEEHTSELQSPLNLVCRLLLEKKKRDRLTMTFAATGDKTMTVAGVFHDNQLLGSYVASNALIAENTNSVRDAVVLVKTSSATPAVQDGLKKAVAGFPELKVRTGAQFKEDQKKAIKGFLYFIYALVALSIIIAMVGVINTLALSVLERTREIGLVRSVGMHRRQVRRMIRGEAVVVSGLGAILGLGLGIALGAALVSTTPRPPA